MTGIFGNTQYMVFSVYHPTLDNRWPDNGGLHTVLRYNPLYMMKNPYHDQVVVVILFPVYMPPLERDSLLLSIPATCSDDKLVRK